MSSAAATASEKKPAVRPGMKVGVASLKAPTMIPGRRSFFTYRDLGVTEASGGWMRAQVMTTRTGMTEPTGWHYHVCDGQFVYTLKGWVDLEFEDGSECRLEAGESCFIPGNMPHNEIRTSDDFEALEVCLPANMGTVPCPVPASRAKTG